MIVDACSLVICEAKGYCDFKKKFHRKRKRTKHCFYSLRIKEHNRWLKTLGQVLERMKETSEVPLGNKNK